MLSKTTLGKEIAKLESDTKSEASANLAFYTACGEMEEIAVKLSKLLDQKDLQYLRSEANNIIRILQNHWFVEGDIAPVIDMLIRLVETSKGYVVNTLAVEQFFLESADQLRKIKQLYVSQFTTRPAIVEKSPENIIEARFIVIDGEEYIATKINNEEPELTGWYQIPKEIRRIIAFAAESDCKISLGNIAW